MAQQVNETGHTKNVAAFYEALAIIGGWGADYKPTKLALSAANLTLLYPKCEKVVKESGEQEGIFDNLVDQRIIVFKKLPTYATRVVNAFSVIDLPDETVAGAIEINRKIQGTRATPKGKKPPTEGETGKGGNISVSQLSYDKNVEHLNDLRAWVELQPVYNPNETDLKVAAIKAYCTQLDLANKAVINGEIPYSNKLDERDALMYAPKTGMVDLILEVKKYAKGAFGATSAKYKQISGLKLRKLPRKK